MSWIREHYMRTKLQSRQRFNWKGARKATKLVPSIRYIPYECKTLVCCVIIIKVSRSHGDMIMTYSILHGHLEIDKSVFLKDLGIELEVIRLSYLNHIPWEKSDRNSILRNSLLCKIAEAQTVNRFKALFDNYNKTLYICTVNFCTC